MCPAAPLLEEDEAQMEKNVCDMSDSADIVPFQLCDCLYLTCAQMQDGMLVCSPSFWVLKVMQKTRRKLLEVPYSKLWGVFQFRRNQKKELVWFPNSPGDIRIDRNAIHSKSAGICNGHSLQLVNLPLHLVCHPLHDRIRLQSNHLHKPTIPEEAAKKRDGGIVQKPKFRQQTLHRFQNATERKEARWASRRLSPLLSHRWGPVKSLVCRRANLEYETAK
jgi:hypothetical protein